jgi:uncharacterized protein (DUF924 family)
MTVETGEAVLRYWFGSPRPDGRVAEECARRWFAAGEETDAFIRERFGRSLERAAGGELADWALTPRGRLALIVLLDQFSRNVHRGTSRAFAHDALALRLCVDGIAAGMDRELAPIERAFFYMPLQHAEDREAQRRSVACLECLAEEAPPALVEQLRGFLDYARRHREVIERFGRFPHRNAVLGRPSTPEERAFLAEHEGFL